MSVIAIDLGNTLYPTIEAIAQFINQRYGVALERMPLELETGDPFDGWDIDEDTLRQYIQVARDEGNVHVSLPPVPGAAEEIRRLHDQGHEIWILSDRAPDVKESIEKWLEDNEIPYERLIMLASNKAAYPIDTLIDDDPRQLEMVGRLGGETALFERPWNEKQRAKYPSFSNWDQVSKVLGIKGVPGADKLTTPKPKKGRGGVGTNQYAVRGRSKAGQKPGGTNGPQGGGGGRSGGGRPDLTM